MAASPVPLPPAPPSPGAAPWRLIALTERLATPRRVLLLTVLVLAFALGFDLASRSYAARIGPNVVDLQLSFTAGAFQQILLAWDSARPDGIAAFKRTVLLLDFLFPLAYAAFLGALYTWVVRTGGGGPSRLVQVMPWLAAAFDVVENALTLWILRGVHDADSLRAATFSPAAVGAMSSAAALKLALVVLTLVLTVVALCVGARGRVLWRCRFSALSLLLGSVPLIALPQGVDLLLSLGDPTASGSFAGLWFFVSLVMWGFSVWYWARVLLMARVAADPPATGDEPLFATWVPRVLGMLTIGLVGAGFIEAARVSDRAWVHWVMAAACFLLAAGFLQFAVSRRKWMRKYLGVAMPSPEQAQVTPGTLRAARISLAVSLALFVLLTAWPVQVAPALGAVTVLLVAAANLVFFGSMAVFLERRLGYSIVVVGVIAAAVFSRWNDNHEVRLVRRPPAFATSHAARPPLRDAFREWFAGLQATCAPGSTCPDVPVYLVAAEGGGIRAAYWTSGVLSRLQDARPEFGRHLFAISGVSGGSVGAAVFASLVRDSAQGQWRLPCSEAGGGGWLLEPCSRRILSGQFLAPTLAKLVAGDFAQWFVPLPVRVFDRGTALENAWSAAYEEATGKGTLDGAYLGLWPEPAAGVPALVLNGTHVQSGRRIVTTPFSWTRDDIPDAYDLHGLLGSDVRLSTAAHNSARFAYVSPAGRLLAASGEDRGHIVDGGYFENSGAETLHDILKVLRTVEVGPGPRPRFVVIYICNSPERCHGGPSRDGGEQWQRPADLAEWFSPLRALLGAREARGSLALSELMHDGGADFVELGVCRPPEEARRRLFLPLGWQLSSGVREWLDRQVRDVRCGARDIP